MQRRDTVFVAAVILGIALRLWLTATTLGSSDVIYKITWAHLAERFGTAQAFAHSTYMNDPPLAVAASVVLDRFGARHELAFGDLFRVAQTLADLVSLACLALLAGRKTALLYFLSPAAIMISGFHCNADPTMVACLLAALVLCARGWHAGSGAALALATGVKVVPLLLLPLFLIASPRRARFALAWLAMMLVLFGIPTAIGGSAVLRNTFLYSSVGNWWGVTSMLHFVHASVAEELYHSANSLVVVAAVGAIALLLARNRLSLPASCGLVFLALLVLGAGFGVQYLLWPLAFLPFLMPRAVQFVVQAGVAAFLFTVYTTWSLGFPWWFANSDAPGATTDGLVFFGWVIWLTLAIATLASVRAGFSHQEAV